MAKGPPSCHTASVENKNSHSFIDYSVSHIMEKVPTAPPPPPPPPTHNCLQQI